MNSQKSFWRQELETLSIDALSGLHEQKFQKQLEYVFRCSPFYQNKFKEHGLTPADISGLEDIVRLPFTEKKELREAQMSNPPVGIHSLMP